MFNFNFTAKFHTYIHTHQTLCWLQFPLQAKSPATHSLCPLGCFSWGFKGTTLCWGVGHWAEDFDQQKDQQKCLLRGTAGDIPLCTISSLQCSSLAADTGSIPRMSPSTKAKFLMLHKLAVPWSWFGQVPSCTLSFWRNSLSFLTDILLPSFPAVHVWALPPHWLPGDVPRPVTGNSDVQQTLSLKFSPRMLTYSFVFSSLLGTFLKSAAGAHVHVPVPLNPLTAAKWLIILASLWHHS